MAASSSSAATSAAAAMPGTASGARVFPGPPPPTPSNHHPLPSAAAAGGTDAALSAFLHRVLLSSPAPALRSPLAARSQTQPSLPPLVSLESADPRPLREAAAGVGFFHLSVHGIPSQPPSSALDELSQIDASARRASSLCTLGFSEEEHEADGGEDSAVVFDVDQGAMEAFPAAEEYARRMKDVGMKVVELLSACPDVGFGEEPFAAGKRTARCLVWFSKVAAGDAAPPSAGKAKAYPYVVALHCQMEPASWVMDDGGDWTAVGARDSALLVTIGDIAQVWSNGELKNARGMAHPTSAPMGGAERLSVTVLITLPLDSVVSPLGPCPDAKELGFYEDDDGDEMDGAGVGDGDGWRFRSFLLEDYAWRVYHERLQFKDPLARYRI